MEYVVYDYLPEILKNVKGICKCEDCMDDIAALALNKLKPHYVKTQKGEVYSKLDEMQLQFKIDVVTAIMESIQQVAKNPSHTLKTK